MPRERQSLVVAAGGRAEPPRLPARPRRRLTGSATGPKQVPVTLAARATAIGTLELYCVAKDGGNRWRLEFNTRQVVGSSDEGSREPEPGAGPTEVVPEHLVQTAAELVRGTFG